MVLTDDPKIRDTATAFRMATEIITVLIGNIFQGQMVERVASSALAYRISALVIAELCLLTAQICVWGVRYEMPRSDEEDAALRSMSFFKGFALTLTCKPYLLLMLLFLCSGLCIQLVQGNLILYITYSIDLEADFANLLMVLLIATFLFIALLHWVLRRIGKRPTYAIGMSILIPILVALFFVPAGNVRRVRGPAACRGGPAAASLTRARRWTRAPAHGPNPRSGRSCTPWPRWPA